MDKKIAILTTSQAQPKWYMWPKEKQDEFGLNNPPGMPYKPCYEVSELFQKLIDLGYRVIICSSRESADGPLDAGWRQHVRPDDIFTKGQRGRCGQHCHTARCQCLIDMVKRVHVHLGETWEPGEYDSWMAGLDHLDKLGYATRHPHGVVE